MCVGAPAGAFSEPKIATPPQIFYASKIKNVCGRSRSVPSAQIIAVFVF